MPDKSLTLSIIIPVYNEEDYLGKCLDSIAAQTLKPLEVIVVDNNSTDKTVAIARSYPFVKVLHEPRQGVNYATQTGFNQSSGKIIGRIDADTILNDNWTKQILDDLRKSDIIATTGPVSYYDMPLPKNNFWFDNLLRMITYNFSPKTPFLYGSNMALKQQAWEKVKNDLCDDEDIHEDIDIAIHLRRHDLKILYDKKLLSKASGRRYNDGPISFFRYLSMYRRTYKKHGINGFWIYPAIFMWALGYLLVHPWRQVWYFFRRKSTDKYPISSRKRKNPMSHSRS